jgi:hypothetical protein
MRFLSRDGQRDRIALALTLAALALVSSASPGAAQAPETYDTAIVDATGQLTVTTVNGRLIQIPGDSGQVGFQDVTISPNRRAVGWLALFPNCCTSYPIPLELVVWTGGELRSFMGTGLPVWKWRFDSTSTQVAFFQETVHSGIGSHYELRDIVTGNLVAEYDPNDHGSPPSWASPLSAP